MAAHPSAIHAQLRMHRLQGGVALALQLPDLKLLFIGSHFAAHDDNVERRNADFHRIRTGLFTSGASSSSNVTEPGSSDGGSSSLNSSVLLSSTLRQTARNIANVASGRMMGSNKTPVVAFAGSSAASNGSAAASICDSSSPRSAAHSLSPPPHVPGPIPRGWLGEAE
jgi:hypothetical protein